MTFEHHEMTLHGQRVSYRTGGSGPALLLLHGIANSSETWAHAAPLLSERFTVIAPDLLGHGKSATPRGDYSLGAHASGARDVATALGHERVTLVGHSLGGGIAMQFAYQFPERTERLVLVSSGGLGRDIGGLLARIGLRPADDIAVLGRGFAELDTTGSRQAFLQTLRAVVEPGGQRVSAVSRLALAARLPTLIVWGENDSIIPVAHGAAAHEAMPGSRFVSFEGAGHMPQEAQPHRFASELTDFVDATEPGRLTHDHWQPLLEEET